MRRESGALGGWARMLSFQPLLEQASPPAMSEAEGKPGRLDERWHGSCSTATRRPVAPVSTRSRGIDARDDHDLKTSRWQEDTVHETVGLDETSTPNAGTVAVRRQEQLGPASPSTARRTRFRTRTPSPPSSLLHPPSNSRTQESHRNHNVERAHVARDNDLVSSAGIQRAVMNALSKKVREAAARTQQQQRGSRNEHLGSTRPSTRPRDGDIREQRPDAALDVLGAACTSTGRNKNRLHQT